MVSTAGRLPGPYTPFLSHLPVYASENTRLSEPTVDWKAACLLRWGTTGENMQKTQAYVGSKQTSQVRICERENREMLGVLSRSLPSFCRRANQPQGDATHADDVVEKALLAAYKHLSQFPGSTQMSTWLTAIALLILEPDCAEGPVPGVSHEITTVNLLVAGSGKQEK
jgi:hypothetical protein